MKRKKKISALTREVKIQMTLRYSFSLIRLAKIQEFKTICARTVGN